ncbi:LRR domain containing protein [Trema orientale]|uniref:LRR domain containing protein n=1 Tax=Trema orientale TaxID=63057 RepID=A0A2P5EJS8_TREOI|nr:LRR domain containing protein [Trema orientale]
MSSTTSKRTIPISSYESSYVTLDLLSYLKSGQITPFQVFNEVIIPDFLLHLSKARHNFLPSSPQNLTHQNGVVALDNHQTLDHRDFRIYDIEEEDQKQDGFGCEEEVDTSSQLLAMYEEIQNDVVLIQKVCGELERWETGINGAIKDLVLQSLDDAFKERTEKFEENVKTHFLKTKLRRTRDIVSILKERIYSPLKFSSTNLDSESFKRFKITRDARTINWPLQLPALNIAKEIVATSTREEIRAVYEDLHPREKLCLLCFSVFPENAVIKKKVLVHWWVGEGFIDSLNCGEGEEEDESAEKTASGFFKKFMARGIIEPVFKKRRPSADSCCMRPSVRFAIIMLAERAGFIKFDADKNPKANFSGSRRACLVKSEEGSSVKELMYGTHSKQGNVRTVFNVSEHRLEFKSGWFSKMKYVRVLQLGRWESSAKHVIEVEDSEFLKGLKRMKHLRYLSLRGVSAITELPNSVSKLESLRILNLNGCHDLEKLPDGIGSLKNLTHLDMYECSLISHMPKGLASLSELQVLKGFVIGKPRPGGQYCQLEDLTRLEHLKKLSIHVDRNSNTVKRELNSLENFEKLKSLSISWSRIYDSSIPLKGLQKALSMTKRLASIRSTPHRYLGPPAASILPAPLEKLDIHYFPGSKISEWFSLGELEKSKKLRKLYIRGGELSNLKDDKCCWKAVEFLRLKFLSELEMDWREMRALFPELTYMEKCKCPNLWFFPGDESGIWKNN